MKNVIAFLFVISLWYFPGALYSQATISPADYAACYSNEYLPDCDSLYIVNFDRVNSIQTKKVMIVCESFKKLENHYRFHIPGGGWVVEYMGNMVNMKVKKISKIDYNQKFITEL